MNDSVRVLAGDLIDLRYKGFAPAISGESVASLAQRGCSLTDAGFTFPLLTLQRSAVEHNIAAMARYCREHGVQIAPRTYWASCSRPFSVSISLRTIPNAGCAMPAGCGMCPM